MAIIVSTAHLPDECRSVDLYGSFVELQVHDGLTEEEMEVRVRWEQQRLQRELERAPAFDGGVRLV